MRVDLYAELPKKAARESLIPPAVGPVAHIAAEAAAAFGLTVTDIVSSRRDRRTVRARHAVFYLARRLTTKSLPAIGAATGGRDHTTIAHGVEATMRRMSEDAAFRDAIVALETRLWAEMGVRTIAEELVDDIIERLRMRLIHQAHVDPEGLVKRLAGLKL